MTDTDMLLPFPILHHSMRNVPVDDTINDIDFILGSFMKKEC